MKVTINKRLYDTDRAKLIKHYSFGRYGDPKGYEERIYQEYTGQYFMQGIGGHLSKYPEPKIVLMKKSDVIAWSEMILRCEEACCDE